MNEKDHELPFKEHRSSSDKECVQDADIVKATGLKRKESSRGRHKIKAAWRRPWLEKEVE